jgi:hypothetical protein
MKFLTLSATTLFVLFFASCVKDAGTGSSSITFQLKAAVSPVNGAAITWTAGSAGVASTKIEAKKNDSTAIEFKSDPNTQVDLFGTVSISNIAIPSGTFRNVEFRSELQPLISKPSLHLEGTYTAGGVTTPISFDVSTAVTVKSKRDSIVIAAGTNSYTAITTVGLLTLTQDVTEADLKAADRTSGKIIISATANVAVYNKMLANLAKPQVIDFH